MGVGASFLLVFVKGGVMVVNHGGTTHMLGEVDEGTILPQSRQQVAGYRHTLLLVEARS